MADSLAAYRSICRFYLRSIVASYRSAARVCGLDKPAHITGKAFDRVAFRSIASRAARFDSLCGAIFAKEFSRQVDQRVCRVIEVAIDTMRDILAWPSGIECERNALRRYRFDNADTEMLGFLRLVIGVASQAGCVPVDGGIPTEAPKRLLRGLDVKHDRESARHLLQFVEICHVYWFRH
jgi:hypothetical protein